MDLHLRTTCKQSEELPKPWQLKYIISKDITSQYSARNKIEKLYLLGKSSLGKPYDICS